MQKCQQIKFPGNLQAGKRHRKETRERRKRPVDRQGNQYEHNIYEQDVFSLYEDSTGHQRQTAPL